MAEDILDPRRYYGVKRELAEGTRGSMTDFRKMVRDIEEKPGSGKGLTKGEYRKLRALRTTQRFSPGGYGVQDVSTKEYRDANYRGFSKTDALADKYQGVGGAYDPGTRAVYLNEYNKPESQRKVIAHEAYGHDIQNVGARTRKPVLSNLERLTWRYMRNQYPENEGKVSKLKYALSGLAAETHARVIQERSLLRGAMDMLQDAKSYSGKPGAVGKVFNSLAALNAARNIPELVDASRLRAAAAGMGAGAALGVGGTVGVREFADDSFAGMLAGLGTPSGPTGGGGGVPLPISKRRKAEVMP